MSASKRIASWALLALLALAGTSAMAGQARQAVVTKVQGVVQMWIEEGKPHAVIVGESLPEGATFKTGPGGLVGLALGDGSQVWLRENTELTVKEAEKGGKRTTLMDLARGAVRLLVKKLHKDDRFEVRTTNAVAAVKGTDWEMGFDPQSGESKVKVFSTEGLGVLLADLSDKVHAAIHAGEMGVAGEDGVGDASKLSAADLAAAKSELEALLKQVDELKKDQVEAPKQGPALAAIEESIQGLIEDVDRGQRVEGAAAEQGHHDDVAKGLVTYDRFGYQVLLAHRVERPDPATVIQTHVTDHLAGPDAGIDTLVESLKFNQALPKDWASVAYRAINDSANLDAGNYPIFFPVLQDWCVSNPLGESIDMFTVYEAPSFCGTIQAGSLTIIDPSSLSQGYTRTINIMSNLAQPDQLGLAQNTIESFTASGSSLDANYDPAEDEANYRVNLQTTFYDAYNRNVTGAQSTVLPDGSMATDYTYTDYYRSRNELTPQVLFTITHTLLDETGLPADGSGLTVPTLPIFYKSPVVYATRKADGPGPISPSLDNLHSMSLAPGILDMTINSTFLSAEIDLLFENDTYQRTFTWPTSPDQSAASISWYNPNNY